MITTSYSILILNRKITDSVRPLIMAAWHFLMVMKCWIGLYFKKLKRTHPSLSLPPFLFFFNYSLNYIIFLSLCVRNRKERTVDLSSTLSVKVLALWFLSEFCSVTYTVAHISSQRRTLWIYLSVTVKFSLLYLHIPQKAVHQKISFAPWTEIVGKGLISLETKLTRVSTFIVAFHLFSWGFNLSCICWHGTLMS